MQRGAPSGFLGVAEESLPNPRRGGKSRSLFLSSRPFDRFRRLPRQLLRIPEPPKKGSRIRLVGKQRIFYTGMAGRQSDLLLHLRCIVLRKGKLVAVQGIERMVQFAFERLPICHIRFLQPIQRYIAFHEEGVGNRKVRVQTNCLFGFGNHVIESAHLRVDAACQVSMRHLVSGVSLDPKLERSFGLFDISRDLFEVNRGYEIFLRLAGAVAQFVRLFCIAGGNPGFSNRCVPDPQP